MDKIELTEKDVNITLSRLNDQIAWYSQKSRRACFYYKFFKVIQILMSAVIPLVSLFVFSNAQKIMAVLGALILIAEGIQQLNQYQQTWLSYRSISESLKQEKYTFLARSGVYAAIQIPEKLLSERIENLMNREHNQWFSFQSQTHIQEQAKTQKLGKDKSI